MRFHGGARAKIGEVQRVVAAGGGVEGELILEWEGAFDDEVMDDEEALEGDERVVGAVEAVHDGADAGGNHRERSVPDVENRGDAVVRRRR